MATVASSVPATRAVETANASRRYEVTSADLPLCCPMPRMTLWNSHPRIYLPIVGDGGETTCPYCGALYVFHDTGDAPAQPA